jgi:hypothetical protein
MGKIIRRTVTITITESWTIVWTDEDRAGDTPQVQVTTLVQDHPKAQEEPDETILPAVTTVTATHAPPDDGAAKPETGNQRKRKRRRRVIEDQPST